jgi:hypothetical protein
MVQLGIFHKIQVQLKTSSQKLGVFLIQITAEFAQELDPQTGMGASLPLAQELLKKHFQLFSEFENETQMLLDFKKIFEGTYHGLNLSVLKIKDLESAVEWSFLKNSHGETLVSKNHSFLLRMPFKDLNSASKNKLQLFEIETSQSYSLQQPLQESIPISEQIQRHVQINPLESKDHFEKSSLAQWGQGLLIQFQLQSVSIQDPLNAWALHLKK